MSKNPRQLYLISQVEGVAGPAAFSRRLASGLRARGHRLAHSDSDGPHDAALVIGGTRRLGVLRGLVRRGVPIVQRLDGINWLHRVRRTGLRHYLRAELNNWLMRLVRDRYARRVVYQSRFAQEWWERTYGPAPAAASVVHNGVPLDQYTPQGPGSRPTDRLRVLLVEANLAGGYEIGLEMAVELATRLQSRMAQKVELSVAGRVEAPVRARWEPETRIQIAWLGLQPPEQIPALDRSAHLLYAADLNPACPNSVIEALACGLPVVSFATGALPELVQGDAGRLVHYGTDPWRLEPPNLDGLVEAASELIEDQPHHRRTARSHAEVHLGLDLMVDGYLRAFGWDD